MIFFYASGNIAQTETLVLNVSGRILMVNKETNGNATEHLVSEFYYCRILVASAVVCSACGNKEFTFIYGFLCSDLHKTSYLYVSLTIYHWSCCLRCCTQSLNYTLHNWQSLRMQYRSVAMDEFEIKISRNVEIKFIFFIRTQFACSAGFTILTNKYWLQLNLCQLQFWTDNFIIQL